MRVLAVLEAPGDHAVTAERLQKPLRLAEEQAAKADTLVFGAQVEFVDLAFLRQRPRPVEAERRITGDGAGDIEHEKRGGTTRRLAPPGFAAAVDHLDERLVRNEAAIGLQPRHPMRLGYRARVLRLGAPHIDRQCLHNTTHIPAPIPPESRIARRSPLPTGKFEVVSRKVNAFLRNVTSRKTMAHT